MALTLETSPPMPLREAVRAYVEAVVRDNPKRKYKAIEKLGIARSTFFRMQKRWQLGEESLIKDRR